MAVGQGTIIELMIPAQHERDELDERRQKAGNWRSPSETQAGICWY